MFPFFSYIKEVGCINDEMVFLRLKSPVILVSDRK